jgi:hypothetical protein
MKTADRALLSLLVATAVFHLVFELAQPAPELFGDEKHYLALARDDARADHRSMLPGNLRFSERPQFYSRFVSQFVFEATPTHDVTTRVAFAQILLLLGLVVMVYLQARTMGLSEAASLVSAAAVAGFPWLGFYVHSLWPEILHAFLLAGVVLTSLLYLHTQRSSLLIGAGSLAGLAMLTKGVLPALSPVFLAAFFGSVIWQHRAAPLTKSVLIRALLAPLIFSAALFCVIGPQLINNAREGGGAELAANRWWNLEIGLTVPVDATDPDTYSTDHRWIAKDRLFEVYKSVPDNEREAHARTRTLSYLADQGLIATLGRQGAKLVDLWIAAPTLILQRQASFDQALGMRARWGETPPEWIAAPRELARWAWRLVFPLGLAGLFLLGRRGIGGQLLLAMSLVFLIAALAVPLKVRLILPVMPILAIGLGELFDTVRASVVRRHS